jgi:hypothetical protein
MAWLIYSQGKIHWFPLDTMLDALQTVRHCGDKKNLCPYREANPSSLVVKSLSLVTVETELSQTFSIAEVVVMPNLCTIKGMDMKLSVLNLSSSQWQ